jgi:hypothetical protein
MNLIKAIDIVEKIRKNSKLAMKEYNCFGAALMTKNGPIRLYSQPDEDVQIKCIEKIFEMGIKIDIINMPIFAVNDNGKFVSIPVKSVKVIDGFDSGFFRHRLLGRQDVKTMFFYQWIKVTNSYDLIRLATYKNKVDIWKM